MERPIPLSTLLSWPLVAFTIEFDNEAEHRVAHRTTDYGVVVPEGMVANQAHAPWLVSLAMFMNCLRFVDRDGLTLAELHRLARTETNLNGMERWGYIQIAPSPGAKTSRSAQIVRATRAGQHVREVCQALLPEIETRWRQRFGESTIASLRESLLAIVTQLDPHLPDCMPILGYGLRPDELPAKKLGPAPAVNLSDLPLPALLARTLTAFALEFDRQSEVSLAISANVLRLLDSGSARIRHLPQESGASKEAIAVATGFLTRHGYATLQPESAASRIKTIALTSKGENARRNHQTLLPEIEDQWRSRLGAGAIDGLRASLSLLIAESPENQRPLMRAIEPYPEGWRARAPKPKILPHFPLVTHRGGYPDGS